MYVYIGGIEGCRKGKCSKCLNDKGLDAECQLKCVTGDGLQVYAGQGFMTMVNIEGCVNFPLTFWP